MAVVARDIPLELITPKAGQPRQQFDDESLRELAQSMDEIGLVTPITIRENGSGYEIVAGERRYRAARLLEWETIEAKIADFDGDEGAYVASFVENEQRLGLSPVETAQALQEIVETQDLTQAAVARRVGRSRSWVAQKLRLLKLPTGTQALVEDGSLAEGHGRQLLKLQTAGKSEEIEDLAERANSEDWSVSRLQSEVDVVIAGEPDLEPETEGLTAEDATEVAFRLGEASAQGVSRDTMKEWLSTEIDGARDALAQAESLKALVDVIHQAEALRRCCGLVGGGIEMKNDAALVKIKAERRAGQILREMGLSVSRDTVDLEAMR